MKKKLILTLDLSSMFLANLTSCDSNVFTKSTMDTNESVTTTETKTNENQEKLYEKVFNEFKISFDDITKDDFMNNVDIVKYNDAVHFYYKSSCIQLDLTGEFINKLIDIEEDSNVVNRTLYEYINNEWIVNQVSKFIDGEEYVLYQLGYSELFNSYYKLEYTYDDNGNNLTKIQSVLENDSWVYDFKNEYTYDDNSKITNLKEYAYHNGWIKIEEKIKYGNELKLVYSLVLKEDLSYDSKTERTYDDNGKQLTVTYSRYINDEWVIEKKTNIIKDRDCVVLDLTYNEDGTFKLKDEYEYDNDGHRISSKKSKYINNEWVIIETDVYSSDYRIITDMLTNEDGSYKEKYEKTYSNAKLIMEIYSIYENDEWVYDYKREYERDDNGYETILVYFYSNGEWVLQN